jgi:N-acetylglucosaminyldiphosphoundecaprenol N-acetyl-beta-D-mannosaminyltransferase
VINQENIPGIEFAKKLIAMCEVESYSIGLLGAKEEVVQKAGENLRAEFPTLNITYLRNGYFNAQEEDIIIQEMKSMSPKVIFVALGAPKQEFLISKAKQEMPDTIFIGVGGSFDVWSGNVRRAPVFYQKSGLEWLNRTIKEPARFKRIFPALPLFLIRVIIESVSKKFG